MAIWRRFFKGKRHTDANISRNRREDPVEVVLKGVIYIFHAGFYPQRVQDVTPCSVMPQGTIPEKCVRSGDTFSEIP